MAGDNELLRLAQLLKLCGDLASSIAATRDDDSAEIRALAAQTSAVAHRLEKLVAPTPGSAADAFDRLH